MELKSTDGLNKALNDIETGQIFPVYLICGDESYLIKEAFQRIVEAILPEKDGVLSLETFEGDREDWEEILLSLKTYPLFGTKRVIAVRDTEIFYSKLQVEEVLEKSKEEFESNNINEAVKLFRIALGYLKIEEVNDEVETELENVKGFGMDAKSKGWIKRMVQECGDQDFNPITYEDSSDKLNDVLKKSANGKGLPKSNILILTTDHVDKRKRLYKTISDLGVIIDFSIQRVRRDPAEIQEEERRTLQQQANELLKASNKKLTKDGFDALLNKTGYDVGMFINELEKVIISAKGGRIESKDIEEIVGRTKEDSIFDLQKAVGRRDSEGAIFYLQELLGQGEFYLRLLQGIANEIRNLIMAKEFIETQLKDKWNPQMDGGLFKRSIYFPIVLKVKREKEADTGHKKSRHNIYKMPTDALLELLKNSEKFTKGELRRFMSLLADTDLKTKTLRVPPVQLLEKALMEICLGKEGNKATTLQ